MNDHYLVFRPFLSFMKSIDTFLALGSSLDRDPKVKHIFGIIKAFKYSSPVMVSLLAVISYYFYLNLLIMSLKSEFILFMTRDKM